MSLAMKSMRALHVRFRKDLLEANVIRTREAVWAAPLKVDDMHLLARVFMAVEH